MEKWRTMRNDEREYNTVQDTQKEYEDPEYFYGAIGQEEMRSQCSHTSIPSSAQRMVVNSPPPPPPPMMKSTHIAIHNTKKTPTPRWRAIFVAVVLFLICLVLFTFVIGFLLLGSRVQYFFQSQQQPYILSHPNDITPLGITKKSEMEISPNHLLTLLITRRKVCLFEAGSGDEDASRNSFLNDHIESARLLFHSNLSHSGVPVHPLQFQRYARSLGVDNDCHVVIYDRGQIIWSTYAAWAFKLFGHAKVSLLAGNYLGWKTQQSRSPQYRTETGEDGARRQGDFLSSWNESVIITFDDVFLNTEINTFDLIDAQTKEEYDGLAPGALYGHIRGAVNVPVDMVYDWSLAQWMNSSELVTTFANAGLTQKRTVVVYCSTSLRSSMIWWALSRLNFKVKIYFGGWPEWVVRAPDELKVLNRS